MGGGDEVLIQLPIPGVQTKGRRVGGGEEVLIQLPIPGVETKGRRVGGGRGGADPTSDPGSSNQA
jgi:hypothetical protein